MNVTGSFRGDALKRQITESVLIERTEHIINRRDEWRQLHLPRSELALTNSSGLKRSCETTLA